MTAALRSTFRPPPLRLPERENPSTCLGVKGLRDAPGGVMNELFLLTPEIPGNKWRASYLGPSAQSYLDSLMNWRPGAAVALFLPPEPRR